MAAMSCLLQVAAALLLFQASAGVAASTCPAGYYCPTGSSVPILCPDGHSCPDPRTHAVPCPPGTQSRNGFGSVRLDCLNCSYGYYQDKPGQKYCLDCPDGHKCPDKRTRPIPCPPGSHSRNEFASVRIDCLNCSDGVYQDKPGQKYCLACPDGHKCPDKRTRPIPCPPGTQSRNGFFSVLLNCTECLDGYYQDRPGQKDCILCPDGHSCPAPKTRPIPCSPGSHSRNGYTSERLTCSQCSDGNYQDKAGQKNCLLCPEGHECPSPKNLFIPCPPGYANSYGRNIRDLVKCLACGAGYYQNKAGQSRCIVCPNGYYCPQKENGPIACPPGFTSASDVSQKISCVKCSPGQCLAAVPPPVVCRAGSFLDIYSRSCKPCQAGQYQIHSGQTSCQICPEGFYCPTATVKPIPCPIGTYSTQWMGVRTACLACSIGTYQMQQGQNVCPVCPAGHFCTKPNLFPVPCPAGTYASYYTTDRTKCLPCSDQEYQDQSGQQSCKPCPAGFFCPRADLSPQPCPHSTYSTQYITNRRECLPCPSGQYQDQCGQAQCKNLFADGSSPPLGPSSTCPSLSTSENLAASLCGELDSQSAYARALFRYSVGNNDVAYPVVKILPEHLTSRETDDNEIQVCTALAFDKMATAAKTEGVVITINSGFRIYERQEYFYKCHKKVIECNNGNLAAEPGTSNHGTGIALDLQTNCGGKKQLGDQPPPEYASSAVYTWLKNNAHRFGFVRTVKKEPWHWEFRPEGERPSYT